MSQAPPSYDVVIVGGGVVGSAIAYFLSEDAGFRGRVAVIERDPGYATASSSLSTSGIRQQFGTRPNMEMSAFGIRFLRDVSARLGVEGHPAEIGLREPGYLILGAKDRVTAFQARNEKQRSWGFPAELLYPEELGRRFPWLNTEDIGVGSYGGEQEGWFDGPGLLQAFRRRARSQWVRYIPAGVVGLDMSGPSKVAAVRLDTGETLAAGTVVNAAGAWSGQIARMAGTDLPVVPRKRCVFVIDCPVRLPDAPFIFDPGGCFLRPEGQPTSGGQRYICGVAPVVENAPDDFGLEVDHALFEDIIWPALAHRIPGFERLRLRTAWAGLYEYNSFDHSGIIGRHPEIPNFVIASGFSGHGMMHAPATGRGVSELIAYGQYRSIDLSPFGLERIAQNRPIQEHVY